MRRMMWVVGIGVIMLAAGPRAGAVAGVAPAQGLAKSATTKTPTTGPTSAPIDQTTPNSRGLKGQHVDPGLVQEADFRQLRLHH